MGEERTTDSESGGFQSKEIDRVNILHQSCRKIRVENHDRYLEGGIELLDFTQTAPPQRGGEDF